MSGDPLMLVAAGGITIIAGMIFCARIMRRGLRTLDRDRLSYAERIAALERSIDEDRRKITVDEHCRVLYAAVADLLRLSGNPSDYELRGRGRTIFLRGPQGEWRIETLARPDLLLSRKRKKLPGRCVWRLNSPEAMQPHGKREFFGLDALLRCLNEQMRGVEECQSEPPHLAMRLKS